MIFPSVLIWRLPVFWSLTKALIYTPIEEFNVYSLGNWAMFCCLTSDTLSTPLNLQYNSLPIEKVARVPYPPQSMYLILPYFTLLFYREPITLTSLSIVISLQFPHTVRFTDTVLSLEFKDGTALALFKIFATPDILPNAKIFMYLLLSIYNIPVIWASCGNRKDIVCALSPVLPE